MMKKTEMIQKLFLILSVPQAIETIGAIVAIMIGVFILFPTNPFFGVLFGILLAVAGFAIIAIFVNRKEKERRREDLEKRREDLEKQLTIKEDGMDYSIVAKELPVVGFKIAVDGRKDMGLEPQKMLLDLTCDCIPLKRFFWDRSYNIEEVKESPRIKTVEIVNGNIKIRYPCVNVFYNHDYAHIWEIGGRVTFHSKIGPINREIEKLTFQLDEKLEEKLKERIKEFREGYVKGRSE